ncbi:MAG: hypothetical protein AABY22_09400, partial [Nanoarchaeota archaeon]
MSDDKYTIDEYIELVNDLKKLKRKWTLSVIHKMLDALSDKNSDDIVTKSIQKVTQSTSNIKTGRPRKILVRDKEEYILKLHERGLSTSDISFAFEEEFGFKAHRNTINDFINRTKNTFKQKSDAPLRIKVAHQKSQERVKEGSILCPHCQSNDINKHGFRYLKNRGTIQKYQCKDCNKKFSDTTDFKRMINNKETIKKALKLHQKGKSLREISKELKKEGITITHTSIMAWIDKFADNLDTTKSQSSILHSDSKLDTTKNKRAKNRQWANEEIKEIINSKEDDEVLAKKFGLSIWTIKNYRYLFKYNHPEWDESQNHFDKKWKQEFNV